MKKRMTITVKHRRWVPGQGDHAGHTEELPDTRHEVELDIDEERIAQNMGERAVKNKSRMCVDGFVVVTHVRQL